MGHLEKKKKLLTSSFSSTSGGTLERTNNVHAGVLRGGGGKWNLITRRGITGEKYSRNGKARGLTGGKKIWRKEVHAGEGGGDNDGRSEEEGGERQRVFD